MKPLSTLAMLVALLSIGSAHPAEAAEVRQVRVPDGGIHPQAATDSGGRLQLIYFKGEPQGGDAFYVRSEDGGKTFGRPLRVNSQPGSVVVTGTVRGPHLAIGREGRVHVAWMGSARAEPRAGKLAPMLYTRLNEAGDGFEPQRNLITAHPGLDGGGSVAADADGNVYVAWHAPADHGKSAGEQGRRVWIARSQDDGRTFTPETAADPEPDGVCACCGMRIFAAGNGRVFILYRTATDGVNRDARLLVSSDHGRTFAISATDPWKSERCMMSTAAFTSATGGHVTAAWETKGQVRFTVIAPGEAKAAAVLDAPGDGKGRKHPAVAVNAKGQTLLAWTEGTGWNKGGSVAWQVFDHEGRAVPGQSGRAAGLPPWSVPAAVGFADGSFILIH